MTLFVGGPYDGQDLPVDASAPRRLRLPHPEELAPYVDERRDDPGATGKQIWPHIYELDESGILLHYRYVGPESHKHG